MKISDQTDAGGAGDSASRTARPKDGRIRGSAGARRRLGLLVAGALLLSLTGCVWLRLLALKNQLADFDHYVKVDDHEGLAFQFLHPVLTVQDVRYLMELEPTAITTNGEQQTWVWTFAKQHPPTRAEAGRFDLTFATSFAEGKLNQVAVSERVLAILPKWFLLDLARSLGHAHVDQQKRAVSVTLDDPATHRGLTKAEVIQLLGAPCRVTESNATYTCLYQYELKSPSLKAHQTMPARAELRFTKSADQLTRIEAGYGDFRIDLSFESPAAPAR